MVATSPRGAATGLPTGAALRPNQTRPVENEINAVWTLQAFSNNDDEPLTVTRDVEDGPFAAAPNRGAKERHRRRRLESLRNVHGNDRPIRTQEKELRAISAPVRLAASRSRDPICRPVGKSTD